MEEGNVIYGGTSTAVPCLSVFMTADHQNRLYFSHQQKEDELSEQTTCKALSY